MEGLVRMSTDNAHVARPACEIELLAPLPSAHTTIATLESMVSERDQRIALLELHQRETDHRIKNSLQVVASLLRAQTRVSNMAGTTSPATEVADRIGIIARIHDLLCRGSCGVVDLGDLLIQVCGNTARLLDSDSSPFVEVDAVECAVPQQTATAIALIVHELVLNSFKHAATKGGRTRVRVCLDQPSDEAITVLVEDDGDDSPSAREPSPGVGTTLIKRIAQSIGASIESKRSSAGYRFVISLPRSVIPITSA